MLYALSILFVQTALLMSLEAETVPLQEAALQLCGGLIFRIISTKCPMIIITAELFSDQF